MGNARSGEQKWDDLYTVYGDFRMEWHVVPAFSIFSRKVTVCRTTHPSFVESMRWFGVPSTHPCRLENHPGTLIAGDWTISLHSKSFLGVCRFQLHDGVTPDRVLGTDGGNGVVMKTLSVDYGIGLEPNARIKAPIRAGGDDQDSCWYIVPRAPLGWAIVHAITGRRLEVDASGALTLTERLMGYTHWDFIAFAHT